MRWSVHHALYSSLHSNMVLIKFDEARKGIAKNQGFTFQYGSNQISVVASSHSPNTSFTFQYGSNQINPIIAKINNPFNFTFQYGSNQIRWCHGKDSKNILLYIPIWF